MQRRVAICTALALLAFAGNSILARMALADGRMGAAPFTAVRLLAGAAILAAIVALRTPAGAGKGGWASPLALLVYAAGFSFSYLSLTTGTGALILFAAVQMTMLLVAWREGDRLRGVRAVGFVLALTGLVYLVLPGLESPPLAGSLLMLAAGVAWGWYSLLGRSVGDPVAATARSFRLAAPLGLVVWLLAAYAAPAASSGLTGRGVALAILSGAVTSGLGYVVWYAALPGLGASRAATVQLTVPVIAAFGGVILLDEAPSLRLVVAATLILGGVALTLRRSRDPGPRRVEMPGDRSAI